MERETLLAILMLLLGGLAAQPLAIWPRAALSQGAPQVAERRAWLRLWLPVVPTLVVIAWLCGWALQEPDPVHDRFDHAVLVLGCLPFALVALRAALRAAWALAVDPGELPIRTTGLLRPTIVFSPFLARALDEGAMRAALEHERAHARHRDPLRIWLAQIATDLQWPWPRAGERFEAWLEILELARDDEARRSGTSGEDLAAAVLATARRSSPQPRASTARWAPAVDAPLVGDARSLETRIARLLAPLPNAAETNALPLGDSQAVAILVSLLAAACALGALYGEHMLHVLFVSTWAF